mmetsp:Transcript_56235/g.159624  ORF Transcript_56235/g.159624 Transcript_56235/m.159624 type:complete len:248 (-) Transcript_56235:948-1691(-)
MAVTVSDLFREYESDLKRLFDSIDKVLDRGEEAGTADSRQSLSGAERQVGEAEQALRQMDMEARTLPTDQRSALEPTLREYRGGLGDRRRAIGAAKEAATRAALLGADGAGTVLGKSMQDRERMLGATEQLQSSTGRLEEARRQALEAEQIGMDVMSDLRQQRETIGRSHGNVRNIGSNVGVAKHLLESMARRARNNKIMTYAVAVFLLLSTAVVIFLATRGDSSSNGSSSSSSSGSGSNGSSGGKS